MIAVIGRILEAPGDAAGVTGLAARIAVEAAQRGGRVELIGKLGSDLAGDAVLYALTRSGVGHAAVLHDPVQPTPRWTAPGEAPPDEGVAGGARSQDRSARPGAADPADDWLAELDEDAASTDRARTERQHPRSGVPAASGGLPVAPDDLDMALRYLVDARVIVLADPDAPELGPVAADGAAYLGARLVLIGGPVGVGAPGLPPDATILSVPTGDPDGVFSDLVAEYAVALDAGRAPAEAWSAAIARLGAERA